MSEPTIYDGTKSNFAEWRDVLHAYLGAHDVNYLHILLWLEDLGRWIMKSEDLEHLSEDLQLDAEDIVEAKTVLYTLLAKYTSGPIKRNIRLAKAKGIFEQYRKLYFAGMQITPKKLFLENAKIWKVVEATWDGVNDSIESWEAKLEFLAEHGK